MINKELQFIPKGGMCRACKLSDNDCSDMQFKEMPRISKGDRDGFVIVKCVNFKRKPA